MTSPPRSLSHGFRRPLLLAALLALGLGEKPAGVARADDAVGPLAVWDAGASSAGGTDPARRAGWRLVPRDLLELERDPPKARSDPGYYGRAYAFQGDAVVENAELIAVFGSAGGEVVLYARTIAGAPSSPAAGPAGQARRVAAIAPRQNQAGPARLARCRIIQNTADQAIIEATFAAGNHPAQTLRFVFDRTEIVEVRPQGQVPGLTVRGPVEYALVPSLVADDLVLSAADATDAQPICLPSENALVALLPGEDCVLTLTWPGDRQRVTLGLGGDPAAGRRIESIDVETGAPALYLAALRAPGIWHREPLKASYLEKDVTIDWRRPFPARWKTQLTEGDTPTSFVFRHASGTVWRGVVGSFEYPVRFDGDRAVYHLSKRVPPKGDSLVYFLEGEATPASVRTPMDAVKATLGRQDYHARFDPAGRALRTHHRRGETGVRRACTCGCTEAIQTLFEQGREVESREDVSNAVDDMLFFVQCHVERIDEYRRFADDLLAFCEARARSAPDLKPLLDRLADRARQIPRECAVQQDNMRSLADAEQLAAQTRALTARKATNNLAAYQTLSESWRAMGGAQDYVVARCHMIVRRLFQEAGRGCAQQPAAVAVAQEIRQRCQQCLRNPDGYEIWPDY